MTEQFTREESDRIWEERYERLIGAVAPLEITNNIQIRFAFSTDLKGCEATRNRRCDKPEFLQLDGPGGMRYCLMHLYQHYRKTYDCEVALLSLNDPKVQAAIEENKQNFYERQVEMKARRAATERILTS